MKDAGVSLGYGYFWWLWQNTDDRRLSGGYSAMGKYGQSISIFPAADVVIAYKTKDIYERSNSGRIRCAVLKTGVEYKSLSWLTPHDQK